MSSAVCAAVHCMNPYVAERFPLLFPANTLNPSIDRHSGQWRARHFAKRSEEGATGGTRLGQRNDWSAPRRRAGESPGPLSDAAEQSAGSGRVSGAVAQHVLKHRLGMWWGDAITDQPPGMGDHRPAVGRSQHLGDLSCFFYTATDRVAM